MLVIVDQKSSWNEPIVARVYTPTATAFDSHAVYVCPASLNMYWEKTIALLLENEKMTCFMANTVGKKYSGFG